MVGVPRSKGCTTCRRRKVACDQQKPHCQNCQKRGVRCEGYAKHPVILQYEGGGGLKKRNRFEEVELVPESGRSNTMQHLGYNAGGLVANTSTLPYQPNAAVFALQQIEVRCLETYLPPDGSAIQDLKYSWMWSIITMPEYGRALTYSFAALCLARMGLVKKDNALIAQGRSQYGMGLQAIKDALAHPKLAFQDRTLAAIRTLSIYELFTLPLDGISTAHIHEQGMTQWCIAASPQSINTEFALQVFHDVRWCIMNRDIERHQVSALGTEEWKTLPWQNFTKDGLQSLFDIGFELAEVLHQLDLYKTIDYPEVMVGRRAKLSHSCSRIRDELEEWYNTYWADQHDSDVSPSSTPSPGSRQPEFTTFWEATNIIYWWLFSLILNEIISEVLEPEDPQQGIIATSSLRVATKIVAASSYFLADDTGWLGPQRLFFPLRRAIEYLKKAESPQVAEAGMALQKTVGRLRVC